MTFLLSIFGYIKLALSFIKDLIIKYPLQTIIVIMGIFLFITIIDNNNLNDQVIKLNNEKKELIQLNKTEVESHKKTISDNNKMIDNLKKVADDAVKNAKKESEKAKETIKQYDKLAEEHSKWEKPSDDANIRIKQLEDKNKEFFKSWREIK